MDGEHAKEIVIEEDILRRSPEREEVIHARCAGLEVHKKSVYGCVICCEVNGEKRQAKRSFGTVTADLLAWPIG